MDSLGFWIAVVTISAAFVYLLRRRLFTPVNRQNLPPSPRALPIIGHFHLIGKSPHHSFRDLAKKHGPIMGLRLGFIKVIVVSSPHAAELVLKTHDDVFSGRTTANQVGKYLTYDLRSLIVSPYGPYWRNMRKLCAIELLSARRISQFESMRKREILGFIDWVQTAAEKRETVDLSRRISSLIGDMNCLMVFGRKYEGHEIDGKGFKGVTREVIEMAGKFHIADYFPMIGALDLQGMNRRLKELRDIFDGFLEKILKDHEMKRNNEDGDFDFVDSMLALMEKSSSSATGAGFEFDRRHIKAVLMDLLIAGMDTSSAAIEWALSELMKHPKIMKKLKQELNSVVTNHDFVEEKHLQKLHYLNCVIKESMRLHPVAPLLIPHESLDDCELEGFYIPKGSRVLVNAWAIGRDPKVWSEAERFWPERFVNGGSEIGKDFEVLAFGSGRRGCPGMNLGLVLVRLVVAQMVHCFDWEVVCDGELDMDEHFGVVCCRANPLLAIPTSCIQ